MKARWQTVSKYKSGYTMGNDDNLKKAVEGLDTFTKNWCMNCKETEEANEPMFRCKECNFETEDGLCLIKKFVQEKNGEIPSYFGSMGVQ